MKFLEFYTSCDLDPRSVTMNSSELGSIIHEGFTSVYFKAPRGQPVLPNTLSTLEILSYPLPNRFKYTWVKEYYETTIPINHLNVYTNVMNLKIAPNPVMCKTFSQILTNAARD